MKSVSYLIPIPWQDEKPGLHRMIRQIQTRPGMYIGSNTLTPLEHFLDGYRAAERDFGVGVCWNGNLFPLDFYYMHNFADFRLQTNCLCAGWRHNILTYCNGDEEKALKKSLRNVCFFLPPRRRKEVIAERKYILEKSTHGKTLKRIIFILTRLSKCVNALKFEVLQKVGETVGNIQTSDSSLTGRASRGTIA